MSGKGHGGGGEEEGGGHSVGLWYVSFSDMITLLLSFFVMLATFSSYSKEGINKLMGACAYVATYSVLPGKSDRSVQPTDRYVESAVSGSEKPTGKEAGNLKNPRPPAWLADESAYSDRRVFYIPSNQLFWGKGLALTPMAQKRLDLVVDFLHKMPCQVIVNEVGYDNTEDSAQRSLQRAWAVVDYFVRQHSLPAQQFGVSASVTGGAARVGDGAAMQIILLKPGGGK